MRLIRIGRVLLPFALASAALGACEGEEVVPPPDVAGDYTVRYGATSPGIGGDCNQVDATLLPSAFSSWLGDALSADSPPTGTLEVEQDDTDLRFRFRDCDFYGSVDSEGAYYFTGACVDPDTQADLDISSEGTLEVRASEYKRVLEGALTMQVDAWDGSMAPGADGTADCTRTATLDAEGSTL